MSSLQTDISNNHNTDSAIHYEDFPSQEQHHNVAIIGCGYVGSAVARYWQQQGHFVTVTTTREERIPEIKEVGARVVVIKGNDPHGVQALLQNQHTVLLSVAPISDRQVDADAYAETYLSTARNLVAGLSNAPTVKQLIYLSSCSVYGNKNGALVAETSLVDTDNEYNKILWETEQILWRSAAENGRVCILRLGGIYGPGRQLSERLSRFAGKTLPGSGESFTCWIHLDDIVAAVEFVRQQRLSGIYNLVNDLNLTSRELCDRICDRQSLPKVLWDASQPNFRSLNARIDNRKIKAAGYKLIHPDTII